MNKIGNHYEHYEELINRVGKEKIEKRYALLYECMHKFLEASSFIGKVYINERLLMHCVLEYFEDISKVKDAHLIDHANSTKVFAYTSYWILRRHPLQIVCPSAENQSEQDEQLSFVNEKFLLVYLLQFLTHEQEAMPLVGDKLNAYKGFVNTLFYSLKFRKLDAQAIELILLSFQAGQILG